MSQAHSARNQESVTDADVSAALERVLGNDMFSQSERLSSFLTYIVNEAMAGRGDAIRGKTIAQDVYERTPQESGDPENIVRVHARQLRQNLAIYYETEGSRDPIRIHLDSGGYCPRFERVELPEPEMSLRRSSLWLMASVFVVGGALGGLIAHLAFKQPAISPVFADAGEARQAQLTRQAVMEKSAASLQAVNFAEQARGMIFPIFDRPRQELINSVFLHVIETDPDYYGGYAGAAQTLATIAILSPRGPARDELAAQAEAMVQKAISLGPTEPWVQSAKAWVEVAKGDYDAGFRLSSRAKEMAGQDGHILDFHGAVSLFSGRFEDAIEAADRSYLKGGSNQRFANRNIVGAANYHLGNYKKTMEGFEAAAAFGDPLSAPSLAYQAAALQQLGRGSEATQKLEELERSWPNAPLDVMFYGIYQDARFADDLLDPLRELGWSALVAETEDSGIGEN